MVHHTCFFFFNLRALYKKGIYQFLTDFQFLQDQANFWQTDLF